MASQNKGKGGLRKHGRSKRKGQDTALSAFVRGRTTADKYFKAHGLTTHHAYARKVFNLK